MSNTIPRTVHTIESVENPVTLCTGEVYSKPDFPPGTTVALCSVCYGVIMKSSGS